jgi:hypothetical protein
VAELRLLEFVLLSSRFDASAEAWPESGSDFQYPAEDVAQLGFDAERVDDEFRLTIQVDLEEGLPFHLMIRAGARFLVTDAPDLSPEEAQATLVFLAYPYLREAVANLTMRTPFPAYFLPPLIRLPDPSVRGDAEPLFPVEEDAREEELRLEFLDEPSEERGGEPPQEGEDVVAGIRTRS